jgi:hypothetical protein
MKVQAAGEFQKEQFSELLLENLDEITIALEAANRALLRTRGRINPNAINTPSYHLDWYLARPLTTAWNWLLSTTLQKDMCPLRAAMEGMSDVRWAESSLPNPYTVLVEKSGKTSDADKFRVALTRHREPDVLINAIHNYHQSDKNGEDFTNDWLIHHPTLQQMIQTADEALGVTPAVGAYNVGNVVYLNR